MLKVNDLITVTAEEYTNAEVIAHYNDYAVFVPQMIVGEQAKVKVNYVKRNVAYADVVEILQPSAFRTNPPCKHFGECGGCSLMHMDYSQQLLFKQNKVVQNLKKIGNLCLDVLPCYPSPNTLNYRNKLSLPVRGSVGNCVIGMYKKNSHDIVPLDDCLLGEWSNVLVKVVKKYLDDNKIPPYNEGNFKGVVRHLVARYVDEQLLVVIVSNGSFNYKTDTLVAELKKHFSSFGLFINTNTSKNNVILGNQTKHVYGLKYIDGTHNGIKYHLRPTSFFQVNNQVKDAIYSQVKQLLDVSKTQVLIDCFSGIGILTNALASPNYKTYGVEIEPSAVDDANEATKLNNTQITNMLGDAKVVLPQLAKQNQDKILSLVVDPPRKGLGEMCQTLLDVSFNNIVYVSCDSATLARDLSILSQKYNINFVKPYDMFPQTDQVETVVSMSLK